MATTTTPLTTQFIDIVATSTDIDNAVYADIAGKPCTVYGISFVSAADEYVHLKLYNARSATEAVVPHAIFYFQNGLTRNVMTTDGMVFTTGLSVRCVEEAGTGGTTSPSSSCTVRFWLG